MKTESYAGKLANFVDEHETLKKVTEGISEKARELEAGVKKVVSRHGGDTAEK